VRQKAFTLIELLVVISIVALIASVVLASLNAAREKGRIAGGRQFMGNVYRAAADQAVALFDFDDCSSGIAVDRSGNGNNGALQNSPSSPTDTQSGTGCALGLNGSTQYLVAGNSSSLNVTGALTVSAWVRFNSLSAGSIMSKWGAVAASNYSWLLFGNFWSPGQIDFLVSGNGTGYVGVSIPAGTVAAGKWYFITGVYDTTSIKIFLDGKLIGTNTSGTPSSLRVSSTPVSVGVDYDNAGAAFRFLNGAVDNAYIFSKALTAFDIQKIYAEEKGKHFASNEK
jgi:prepilin-type N-terminal cleavage/methylation domain-containing protein